MRACERVPASLNALPKGFLFEVEPRGGQPQTSFFPGLNFC